MQKCFISIIVPVYNVREYVIDCLNSIISQTYLDDLECIIVNDCGNDDSMALVNDFIFKYTGKISFRIINHTCNKGLSAARNTGIRETSGEYLLFVDSDDVLFPDCIYSFRKVLDKYPDSQLIQAGAVLSSGDQEDLYSMEKDFPDYANNRNWIVPTFLTRGGWKGIPVTAWNKLIKKDFLIENNLFFEEGILHEDELWNFILSKKVERIAFCKKNTYWYRVRERSIMNSFASVDANAESLFAVWDYILDNFDPQRKVPLSKMLWGHIHYFYSECKKKSVRKHLKELLQRLIPTIGWPTSFFLWLYLTPIGFKLRFIRKQIIKKSRFKVIAPPIMSTTI